MAGAGRVWPSQREALRPGAAGGSGDQPWAGGFADGVAVYWKASGSSGARDASDDQGGCGRGLGLGRGEVGLSWEA